MSPKISVAMCTYNGSQFLGSQLRSIAEQTRQPDECVICDDLSGDDTAEIIRAFTAECNFPIRFEINQSRLGTTKNFERAISLCDGDIIALADQDDIWRPEKLQRIEEAFLASPEAAGVFSDGELIDQFSKPLGGGLWQSFSFSQSEQRRFAYRKGFTVILKHPVATGCTLAFRSELRSLLLPIPEAQPHDYWISFLLAAVSHLQPIRERLIQYRQHSGQQVGPGHPAFTQQIAIARRTGPDFYDWEIRRLRELQQRLLESACSFQVHDGVFKELQRKIAHRALRARLPGTMLQRASVVLREALRGNYQHYSQGWKSLVKDLWTGSCGA